LAKAYNFRLPEELVQRIDEASDKGKRTKWLIEAIEEKLGADVRSEPVSEPPIPSTHRPPTLRRSDFKNGDTALISERMRRLEPKIPSLLARRRVAIEELTKEGKLNG
jgi:hypothetical protein